MYKLQIVDHVSNEIFFEDECSCNFISALLDSCINHDTILLSKDGIKLMKMQYVSYSVHEKKNIKTYKVQVKQEIKV